MIFQLKDGLKVVAETQNDLVRFDSVCSNVDPIGFDVSGDFDRIVCKHGTAKLPSMLVKGEIWFHPFSLEFK